MTHAEVSRRYRARKKGHEVPLLTKPYTQDEKELITSSYRSGNLNLKELSNTLKRPKANICRFAKPLGLTNKNRPKLALQGIKRKNVYKKGRKPTQLRFGSYKRNWGIWNLNPHPKGMKGRTHNKKYCKEISKRMKKAWANKTSAYNSQKVRQLHSDAMKEWRAIYKQTNPYSRSIKGKRKDVGNMFFKSRWEANFARYLNFLKKAGNIYQWQYEPERFEFTKIKRGTRSYLPDFKVWDTKESTPYFYEIKGWMDAKSKTRLKRMDLYFPHIKLIIIGSREYKAIAKDIKPLIKQWE